MKTAYSTFSVGLFQSQDVKKEWKGIIKRCEKRRESVPEEELFCEWMNLADRNYRATGAHEHGGFYWLLVMSQFLWKYRNVHHYFIAPGVASFCESAAKEITPEYLKRMPECQSVDAPKIETSFAHTFSESGRLKINGACVFHFPAKERQRSVLAIPDFDVPIWKGIALGCDLAVTDGDHDLLMHVDRKRNTISVRLASGNLFDCNNLPTGFDISGRFTEEFGRPRSMAKTILGLSLYMDAFPDAVIDAGSDGVHQIKRYEGTRHVVTRSEIVDEEQRHSVSPHWRRGHFRLLNSEKFVRKQGQTVYVRGTFVKGKAFDVLDDSP